MKTQIKSWLLLGCFIFNVYGVMGQTFEIETPKTKKKITPVEPSRAPNRIIGKRANYSGAIIQFIKTKPTWQAINPFAPKAYGAGYHNTTQDPYSGEIDGLKLFSIEF
ncbi:MAG: hypothetical protein R3F23_03880 [Verrucomicrobiia bacterium]